MNEAFTEETNAALTSPGSEPDSVDFDELERIVARRVQRAENGVVRDYLAQRGIEGESADEAARRFREHRRAKTPDDGELERLRLRIAEAEKTARRAAVDAEARVQLERLGVPSRNRADVLLLAGEAIERACGEDADDAAQTVREALEGVVARLPGLVPEPAAGAGSRGNFPRQEDASASLRRQLEQARADGDTAAAVGVINSAAAKGIKLR